MRSGMQTEVPWGLDRIDSRSGRDGIYSYGSALGSSSRIYILSTGIRTDHVDFQNRAYPGWSAECTELSNCNTGYAAARAVMGEAGAPPLHAPRVQCMLLEASPRAPPLPPPPSPLIPCHSHVHTVWAHALGAPAPCFGLCSWVYQGVITQGTSSCYGTGTHDASIAAGGTYGVAKGATLVSVQVRSQSYASAAERRGSSWGV